MSAHDRQLHAALVYGPRFGWPVFPLSPGLKTPPRGTHGFHDASTDPATIRRWWAQWPGANVGLACGAAGLVVIDLDVKGDVDGLETWRYLKTKHGIDDHISGPRDTRGWLDEAAEPDRRGGCVTCRTLRYRSLAGLSAAALRG